MRLIESKGSAVLVSGGIITVGSASRRELPAVDVGAPAFVGSHATCADADASLLLSVTPKLIRIGTCMLVGEYM